MHRIPFRLRAKCSPEVVGLSRVPHEQAGKRRFRSPERDAQDRGQPQGVVSRVESSRMRGAWFCLLLFLPASAAAAGYADLGKLEREAVDDALALRALSIEPAPQGKIIGAVQVVNLDVFLARERVPLVWANIFHRTTREHHIRRESLLHAGDR